MPIYAVRKDEVDQFYGKKTLKPLISVKNVKKTKSARALLCVKLVDHY
jgi:hypothetical protein